VLAGVSELAGFAAGFALWGLAGSLSSGALEALVYDGLTSYGAEASYPKVLGRLSAVELLGQLVATAGAAALFPLAGFAGVIWASAGLCLWSSVLAARIPEPRSSAAESDDSPGLRTALAFVGRDRRLRRLLIGVALLTGLDTLEEYFPLLAHSWGVPTQWNPLAIVVIPVVGAAGAVASGRMGQLPSGRIGALLGCAGLLLAAAGVLRLPVGLLLVAAFYGLYRLVLVQAGSLLQQHIEPSSRATVTSVAEVGVELCVYLMYAVWVLGGLLLAAAIVVVAASLLPRMLAPPQQPVGYGERVDEEDP
jgi:hypothetical protein